MGVHNRPPDPIETRVHRCAHPLRGGQLFLDALEDEDVRIDAHADRQNETGDAREGHRGAQIRHHAQEDNQVDHDRDHRVESAESVVEKDEEHDEREASD
jgi:hypothetical protein